MFAAARRPRFGRFLALLVPVPRRRCSSHAAAADVGDSVVKLSVTQREPDFFRPWTKASPSKISGSGVVIAGPRILTNAHVVMYASEVFVQLRKGGDQHTAKVMAIAPGIDLAIVELNDPNVLEGDHAAVAGRRAAAAQVASQRRTAIPPAATICR